MRRDVLVVPLLRPVLSLAVTADDLGSAPE
jgi:hypothetical protein